MAIRVCKFQNFPEVACSHALLEPFFSLNFLQIKSAEKIYATKMSKLGAPQKQILNKPLA